MPKRKNPRKNNRKAKKNRRRPKIIGHFILGFKLAAAAAMVAAVSCLFILIHDLVTQCDYFPIDKVTISGNRRLTVDQVSRQAQFRKGDNILGVNLALVRKRLLAHPWIAEAQVGRVIPSGLIIRIKEQTALAVVDVGKKFLINHDGKVFKARDASDPVDLPIISGLNASDLSVFGQADRPDGNGRPESIRPFMAVMQVLQLGEQKESILPNRTIKRIRVDRQIGVTVYAFDQIRTIYLGYSDYIRKYNMLSTLFSYLKRQGSIPDFDHIDLNNLQRVVVNPVKMDTSPKGS